MALAKVRETLALLGVEGSNPSSASCSSVVEHLVANQGEPNIGWPPKIGSYTESFLGAISKPSSRLKEQGSKMHRLFNGKGVQVDGSKGVVLASEQNAS